MASFMCPGTEPIMLRKFALLFAALAAAVITLPHAAAALPSIDAARAACIAKVRPQVIRCVANNMIARGGPGWMYVTQCREPARPIVRTCVLRTLRDAGHPLLVGRPLPAPDAICPLGFGGCMNRCHFVGGWGGASPAQTCSRICARRCAPGFAAREDQPEDAEVDVAKAPDKGGND
jgi:hypothetical protein